MCYTPKGNVKLLLSSPQYYVMLYAVDVSKKCIGTLSNECLHMSMQCVCCTSLAVFCLAYCTCMDVLCWITTQKYAHTCTHPPISGSQMITNGVNKRATHHWKIYLFGEHIQDAWYLVLVLKAHTYMSVPFCSISYAGVRADDPAWTTA